MSSQDTFREAPEPSEARTEPDEPRGRRSKRPYIVMAVLIVVGSSRSRELVPLARRIGWRSAPSAR